MQPYETRIITRTIFLAGHAFVYQAWFEAAGKEFPDQECAAFRHRMLSAVRCHPPVQQWSIIFRSLPLPCGHTFTLEELAYCHFRDQLGWPVSPAHFTAGVSDDI